MKTNYLPEKFAIKIHNEAHSKAVQERLFELGYEWKSGGGYIKGLGLRFILVNTAMTHTPCTMEETVITLDDLYTMERKPEFEPVYGDGWVIEECRLLTGGGEMPIAEAIKMAKKILEKYEVEL